MSDAAALLAAIRAAPDDDAPRLIYADWLDEHGQPERAEFIRVQCELARNETQALRRREAELLAGHHDAFAGPLAAPHLRFRFERGFIAGFGHTGVFAHRYLEEPSTKRSLRMAWFRIFRFHPDGVVQDATSDRNTLVGVRGLFEEGGEPTCGVYALNTDLSPPGLQFSIESSNGTIMDYRGRLRGTSLALEVSGRINFTQSRRIRFVHHPIPGFDSFPDT